MKQSVIIRHRRGKGFGYTRDAKPLRDAKTLAFIQSLAIPPAWRDVVIDSSPRARILARGLDAAGRQQAIYNPVFRAKQEAAKFDRILHFGRRLPTLRRQVAKDMQRRKLAKETVLACIVALMDEAYFRVGNMHYAKAHHSYGITTLRRKHTTISGDTVTFDFTGKSGQQQHKTITDRRIARIMRQLDELPGYEVFQYIDTNGHKHRVTSHDVNRYIKQYMGEDFTAKDFRTWGGTLLAVSAFAAELWPTTQRERSKAVTRCVKTVAKRLGNTPAIARQSYIDPRVIATYLKSDSISKLMQTLSDVAPKIYLQKNEQCTIKILANSKSN